MSTERPRTSKVTIMGVLEDLADALAKDALDLAASRGDEHIVDKIGEVVGATSSTLQEAYLTSVRIRRAEDRGRKMLEKISARAPAKSK